MSKRVIVLGAGVGGLTAAHELAERGYEIVVCPGQVYYLDMALRPDWDDTRTA